MSMGESMTPAQQKAYEEEYAWWWEGRAWHKKKKKMSYHDDINEFRFSISKDSLKNYVFMRRLKAYCCGKKLFCGDIVECVFTEKLIEIKKYDKKSAYIGEPDANYCYEILGNIYENPELKKLIKNIGLNCPHCKKNINIKI